MQQLTQAREDLVEKEKEETDAEPDAKAAAAEAVQKAKEHVENDFTLVHSIAVIDARQAWAG